MSTNTYILGLGISYNSKIKRLETTDQFSLQELFSDYGSPSYNDRQQMTGRILSRLTKGTTSSQQQ